MMSRAYVVYFVMFAALIGGLVLVMTMGESVRAPDDLSGEWVIEWDNAPPPESGEPVMRIAQSGRFFVVTFGQRPPMSMKLQEGWTGKTKGRVLNMRLARPPWELRLNGDIPPRQRWRTPELNLELVGPTRHVGIARRVFPQTAEQTEESVPVPPSLDAPEPPADADAAAAISPAPAPAAHPAAPTASVPPETAHAR